MNDLREPQESASQAAEPKEECFHWNVYWSDQSKAFTDREEALAFARGLLSLNHDLPVEIIQATWDHWDDIEFLQIVSREMLTWSEFTAEDAEERRGK